MPRMINGFDRVWSLARVTDFFDDADFIHANSLDMQEEIEAELNFMSWEEKTSPYGEYLEEIIEKLRSVNGLAEDLRNELSDLRSFLKK